MTATHLESAALLLETHIAVDDPSKDLPEHAEARQMAARPYNLNEVDVPFTEAEVGFPCRQTPMGKRSTLDWMDREPIDRVHYVFRSYD
ncbi:hypothetical protein MRX96_041675 [Rhipicephalus microplus]